MEQLRASPISKMLERYAQEESRIQQAMEAMRSPWLDAREALRSIGGFAEMQSIGHALRTMPAFDQRLTEALRVDLGDWRDRVTWPDAVFVDPIARSEFYVSHGFDTGLTDFPAPAFEESLALAGLGGEPPTLLEIYGAPIPPSTDDDEEEALSRTNTAHDWLLRLETQLRWFIDEVMTSEFGPDWAKHRLPNGMYDKWQDKKRVAEQAGGRPWPLIAFADFTDYEVLICKRYNWREAFSSVFRRQESIRETFQRLYPLRICTMHARPITQDDELLLYVEVRRLISAISRD
jgi:hypothetical protein